MSEPDMITISSDAYFAYVAAHFKARTGKKPLQLRNPFTGEIFWMQSYVKEDNA